MGGSSPFKESARSVKDSQRRATTAKQWLTKPENDIQVTFLEEDTADVDTPCNDPLIVEFFIGITTKLPEFSLTPAAQSINL